MMTRPWSAPPAATARRAATSASSWPTAPGQGQRQSGLPREPGQSLPQGLPVPGSPRAPDRARHPLLRDAAGDLQPVDWERHCRCSPRRFKAIQAQHGPGVGGLPQHRSDDHGGTRVSGRPDQVRHGPRPRRRQHPPVHGHGGRAHKQSFGFDAPPFTYQDFEESDVLVFVGANPVIAHPHHVAEGQEEHRARRGSWSSTRGDRDGRRPRRLEHYAIVPKSDLVLLYGLARLLIGRGWIDRGFVESAHLRLRGVPGARRRVRPGERQRGDRTQPPSGSSQLAEAIHGRGASLLLVDHGGQPGLPGRADRPGHHQPGPAHRQHRPARNRGQLHHRPVQRHGLAAVQQHHQPVLRP